MKRILEEFEDLTQLWFVGAQKRNEANASGLTRWTDPRVMPAAVGVSGPATGPKLQALLDVNRDLAGPAVRPARIAANRDQWHEPPAVEFYVDFETVSDLDDDFERIPERGGQNLIFMIGCGHLEQGEWLHKYFTTGALVEPDEARSSTGGSRTWARSPRV